MGFRTGGDLPMEQQNATRVMAALYGGTPFSKLFANVREKLSLCYYCAARYDRAYKAMLVDSGVEAANFQKAYDEILRQLQALSQGDFTDEELQNTKLLLKTSLRAVTDSLGAIESWYMTQILEGTEVSPQKEIEQVQAVTREDIIQAAGRVTLDTVYFLKGEEA
jgi:predicted Zn-dependent peptidase